MGNYHISLKKEVNIKIYRYIDKNSIQIVNKIWYNCEKKEKYDEIKVIIKESHPIIWRRLRIPANITFYELVAIIEISFERCGHHLCEFEVDVTLHEMGRFIGIPAEDEYGIENIIGEKC